MRSCSYFLNFFFSNEAPIINSISGVLPEKEHQLTGIYDLVAVLTHKGRSADSGHYVAWVKQENGQFNWEDILY